MANSSETPNPKGRRRTSPGNQGSQRAAQHTADQGQHPEQRDFHRAQRAADEDLIKLLNECNFEGPIWERVVDEWYRYGYACVFDLVKTSRIFDICRDLGIPYPEQVPSTERAWSDADVQELTLEVVSRALLRFRELLRRGRWSKTGGATLTTFFINQCALQFANVYRTWRAHQRLQVQVVSLEALAERQEPGRQEVADLRSGSDPASRIVDRAELTTALGRARGKADQMLLLHDEGYSYEEIGQQLDMTRNQVSNGLARFKQQVRTQPRHPGDREREEMNR